MGSLACNCECWEEIEITVMVYSLRLPANSGKFKLGFEVGGILSFDTNEGRFLMLNRAGSTIKKEIFVTWQHCVF